MQKNSQCVNIYDFFKGVGESDGKESENISINGSSQTGRYGVTHALPQEDCDKWNYWNSFMFSFTAITTIGKNNVY